MEITAQVKQGTFKVQSVSVSGTPDTGILICITTESNYVVEPKIIASSGCIGIILKGEEITFDEDIITISCDKFTHDIFWSGSSAKGCTLVSGVMMRPDQDIFKAS